MKEKLNVYIDQMNENQLQYISKFIELMFFPTVNDK